MNFIPFVHVSACSVLLMLPISITELFKEILDYIQGIIFLPMLSKQLNYFPSKTLNMSIQSINIWKITSPIIFQVFREVNKHEVLHV